MEWLLEREVEYWIVDTFARAMRDCGLDENVNRDVEIFTSTLDIIKERAGVRHLILSAHTGRAPQEEGHERSRGATRLDDWADVRWIYTTQDRRRFLRAEGRDVSQPEREVLMNSSDLSLTSGGGDRRTIRLETDVDKVETEVAANPGMTKNQLRERLGPIQHARADAAIAEAKRRGAIEVEPGEGRAQLHYPAPNAHKAKRVKK